MLRQERLDRRELVRVALGRPEVIGGPARLGERAGAVALGEEERPGEEETGAYAEAKPLYARTLAIREDAFASA